MPPQKPGFSLFNKEFQWVDCGLHTNKACWELSSKLHDRYLFSGWLAGLVRRRNPKYRGAIKESAARRERFELGNE